MPTAQDALAALQAKATPDWLVKLDRFGITAKKALGVSMSDVQAIAKQLGRDHSLALALWKTGVYEARMLAAFVDEPAPRHLRPDGPLVPRLRQLGHLRHRSASTSSTARPRSWPKVAAWADARRRVRQARRLRAARQRRRATTRRRPTASSSRPSRSSSAPLTDERNFVKKGVSWALRGHRTPQRAPCTPPPSTLAGSLAESRRARRRAGSARTPCATSSARS